MIGPPIAVWHSVSCACDWCITEDIIQIRLGVSIPDDRPMFAQPEKVLVLAA